MSRYIVLDDDDATLAGGPAAPTADSYNDWGWTLYRQDEDGRLLEAIGSDGGEPEDQLLVRDWKWVAPALDAAYQEGLLEGQAQRDDLARRLERTIGLLSPQLKAAPEDYSESDLQWRRMVLGAVPTTEPKYECTECGYLMPTVPRPVKCGDCGNAIGFIERAPGAVKALIVPCCATCDTGRWVNPETMTCAIDSTHEVFDTRTSLPIPPRTP